NLDATAFLTEEAAYRRRIGRRSEPVGDLLFRGGKAYMVQPVAGRLHAWEIRHHRSPRAMPEFCGHVETAVRQSVDGRRVRGMNFEWKTVRLQPRPRVSPTQVFEESRLDTKKPEYTEDDVKKARLLVAKEDRTALLGLA